MTSTDDEGKRSVWELEGITNRSQAIAFLKLFENTFPVYQPFTEEIYLSYKFLIPKNEGNKIIVEPDFLLRERLARVPNKAIKPVRIFIFPGDILDAKGLYIKFPGRGLFGGSRDEPLKRGLQILDFEYKRDNKQFLPVFPKNSIREYEDGMPHLALALYDMDEDENLSVFAKSEIARAVREKYSQVQL